MLAASDNEGLAPSGFTPTPTPADHNFKLLTKYKDNSLKAPESSQKQVHTGRELHLPLEDGKSASEFSFVFQFHPRADASGR